MARLSKQELGEVRDGLVKYAADGTWFYKVKWRGKIRQGDTKCCSRTTAAEWFKKEKEKWANQEHDGPEVEIPTLRKLWAEWDRLKGPHVSKSHRTTMRHVVNTHAATYLDKLASEFNNLAVQEIKTAYLTTTGKGHKSWKNGPGKDESEHTTRTHTEGGWNNNFKVITALFNWGAKMGMIPAGRPFNTEGVKESVSERAAPIIWPEKVPAFLAKVDKTKKNTKGELVPHMAIACRLMLGLGLRENEALNAEWERVDWRRGVFIVAETQQKIEIHGRMTKKKVKDRAKREIKIPQWLADYLIKWWIFCGEPTSGLLISSKSGKPHGPSSSKAAVRKAGGLLEISNLTPQALRRTFATAHWEAGTALPTIAQMMGHEDPETTRKHYVVQRVHEQDEPQERVAKAMGL